MTVTENDIKKIVNRMNRIHANFESGQIVTKNQRVTFQISVKDLKK